MLPKLEMVQMAHDLARHAALRLGVIAENVAHTDTPRYRAQDLKTFAETYRAPFALRQSRAGHLPSAEAAAAQSFDTKDISAPNGNNVSLEGEMVKAAQARQEHEMALSIYRATANLLRGALGRTAG